MMVNLPRSDIVVFVVGLVLLVVVINRRVVLAAAVAHTPPLAGSGGHGRCAPSDGGDLPGAPERA